jgi:ribosomal protein L14
LQVRVVDAENQLAGCEVRKLTGRWVYFNVLAAAVVAWNRRCKGTSLQGDVGRRCRESSLHRDIVFNR